MLSIILLRIALIVSLFSVMAPASVYANSPEDADEDDSAFTESEIEDGVENAPDVELNLDKTKIDKKTIIRTVRRSDSLLGILTSSGFKSDEVYNFLALPS